MPIIDEDRTEHAKQVSQQTTNGQIYFTTQTDIASETKQISKAQPEAADQIYPVISDTIKSAKDNSQTKTNSDRIIDLIAPTNIGEKNNHSIFLA